MHVTLVYGTHCDKNDAFSLVVTAKGLFDVIKRKERRQSNMCHSTSK